LPLTIEQLVRASSLGLRLVAGKQHAEQAVLSVQTCDLDDPLAWISAGTLLLRTNWGTDSISDRDAALVANLSKEGIAGLGIGVYALSTLPCDRLTEVADEVGLPLLTVPPRTSFQQVATYVVAHNASADTYQLRRTVSLHDMLLTRFENEGIDSVMETACSLLDAQILLLGDGGDVQGAWPSHSHKAASADKPERLWDAYVALASPASEGVLELGLGAVHFAEIRCGEEWSGVLFCLNGSGAGVADLDAGIVTYLKGLVQLYQAGAFVYRRTRREGREALLRQLASGDVPAHRLGAALAYHSISKSDPLVAVLLHPRTTRASLVPDVLDVTQRRRDLMTAALSAVTQYLEEHVVPFLSGWYESVAALVLPAASLREGSSGVDVLAVVRALKQHLESAVAPLTLSVGISEETSSVEEMPTAFSHALQALQRALSGDDEQSGRVVLYSDLGVEQKVLDALPSDLLDTLRSRVIGRLYEADPNNADGLLEVLSSYMNHNGSVAETASTLFMHRNTLRRRVARIEELLGVDLTVFRDVFEVRLGLRADEVIRSRGGGSVVVYSPTGTSE
jgi:PucR family transcriptional regulator, purine catabolism regulatory protein